MNIPHGWAFGEPFIVAGNGNTGKLTWKGEGRYRNHLQSRLSDHILVKNKISTTESSVRSYIGEKQDIYKEAIQLLERTISNMIQS